MVTCRCGEPIARDESHICSYVASPADARLRQPIPAAKPVEPPQSAPVLAQPLGSAFAVHVVGSAGPRYVAWFCHRDQAQRWAEREYPTRYILDRCDLASHDPDDAMPAPIADPLARMAAHAKTAGHHVMLTVYPDGTWEADAGPCSDQTPGAAAAEAVDKALALETAERCASALKDARCTHPKDHAGRHAAFGEWWETDAEGNVTAVGGPGRGAPGGGLLVLTAKTIEQSTKPPGVHVIGTQTEADALLGKGWEEAFETGAGESKTIRRLLSDPEPVRVVTPADLGLPELAQTEVAEVLEAAQPQPPTGARGADLVALARAMSDEALTMPYDGLIVLNGCKVAVPGSEGIIESLRGSLDSLLALFGRRVLKAAQAIGKPPACPVDAPAASGQASPSPEAHEAALAQARAEGDATGYRRGLDVARIQLEQMAHHQHNEAARARAEAECYDQTGDALAQAVAWVALELEQTEEPRS
jgi:hypothetical protein